MKLLVYLVRLLDALMRFCLASGLQAEGVCLNVQSSSNVLKCWRKSALTLEEILTSQYKDVCNQEIKELFRMIEFNWFQNL